MNFILSYRNRDFEVELDEKVLVGPFIYQFLTQLEVDIKRVVEAQGLAWQLWATSYEFDLRQSFQAQARALAGIRELVLFQSSYGQLAYFKDFELSQLEGLAASIKLRPKVNQYSAYLALIDKGVAHYIELLKTHELQDCLEERYVEHDFAELKKVFDRDGLFTHEIFKRHWFHDDKYCDEEPVESLNQLLAPILTDIPYAFELTLHFSSNQGEDLGTLSFNQDNVCSVEQEKMNSLYASGDFTYSLRLQVQNFSLEQDFEFLRNAGEIKIELLNTILKALGRDKKCIPFYDTSFLYLSSSTYEKISTLPLMPSNMHFYDVMEV